MIATPNIIVCDDASAASIRAAELFASAIRKNPNLVLGLATGGTPIAMYQELQRIHRKSGLDFSNVTTFNLDEYIGLAAEHPQSYRTFMQQQLLDHINVARSKTHIPNGLASDTEAHAAEYESRIAAAGGIDLQLLGIGHNGHIAFNEPGSAIDSRTREVELAERTIESNSRFFESADEVPRTAITMGIGTILEAKRIVLLAIGESKAEAIRRVVHEPATAEHPASLLQHHESVTLVLDRAAASLLQTRPS